MVPSLTNLPISDRHCFLAGGRFDPAASSLWTGDHSALKDPAVPWGLLLRAWRPGVLLPVGLGPGFPFCSLMFLFFPRGLCDDRWEVGHGAQETAFPQVSDLREWSG